MVDFRALNDKELRRSYWLYTHKFRLQKFGKISFAIFAFGFFSISVGMLLAYILGSPGHRRMRETLGQQALHFQDYARLHPAAPLTIDSVNALQTSLGVYDLYTFLTNPNEEYTVRALQYHFQFGSASSDVQTTFLLPKERALLTHFNAKSAEPLQDARFVVDGISWRRVNEDEQDVVQSVSFATSDAQFTRAVDLVSNRLNITLENKSPYNFWAVETPIALLDGDVIVGVGWTKYIRFSRAEKRLIDVGMGFTLYPRVTDAKIYPRVNVLDQSMIY